MSRLTLNKVLEAFRRYTEETDAGLEKLERDADINAAIEFGKWKQERGV